MYIHIYIHVYILIYVNDTPKGLQCSVQETDCPCIGVLQTHPAALRGRLRLACC